MDLLSLHHLTVREVSPPELVSIAAEIGCRHVGVFVHAPSRSLDIFPLIADEATRRDVAARLADTGVSIHTLEAFALSPKPRFDSFRRALEIGASLGARRATALVHDKDEARAIDHFARFCALAAEYRLCVGVEFMTFSDIDSLEKAERLVTRADQPNGSIVVDALHLARTGGSPAALAAVSPSLIGYAQICDAHAHVEPDEALREAIEDRLVPGEGVLPLRAFAAALPQGVVIDMEVPSSTLALRGLGPRERARLIAAATRRVLAGVKYCAATAEARTGAEVCI